MRSYAKVHPVDYNYKQATFNKLNFKKVERNPDAILYARLKQLKKITLTYKKWLFSPRNHVLKAI